MTIVSAIIVGIGVWFFLRCIFSGFYTVDQNERAVVTSFGRAERVGTATTLQHPMAQTLNQEEQQRYVFPQVRVVQPGGPYFKFPWQQVHKVPISIRTVNIAFDPENSVVNQHGSVLEAVTKDQLNTGLRGQIRFSVSDQNLYAYLFSIKNPIAHIMGYFVSILRERIAMFEAPNKPDAGKPVPGETAGAAIANRVQGISINDLRKNLTDLNGHMERECASSVARYGIILNAALITGIEPPEEVESALAAINTAHNQVSSEISLAQASADTKIVQSRKAVEIETLKAQAEVQLLTQLADQLTTLKSAGKETIGLYLRNARLTLYKMAKRLILEVSK